MASNKDWRISAYPISVTPQAASPRLKRWIYQSAILPGAESLKSFKLADVTKYATFAPSIGNQYLFYIAMNNAKWNSLPADLQKIFTDITAKYQPESAVGWVMIPSGSE